MKILGLDIATNTGWSILENGILTKYGTIHIQSEMTLIQRLEYFRRELINVLETNKPDRVAIEDVILGISGAKTLAYLSRLNGVAISTCYQYVNDRINLYSPVEWKSSSFQGLKGNASKCEIQIAIIRHYNLIDQENLSLITADLQKIDNSINELKKCLETNKKSLELLKNDLKRKKSPFAEEWQRKECEKKVHDLDLYIKNNKIEIKNSDKQVEKIEKQVGLSLTAKCGLSSDVSDSIGIAYCDHLVLSK